MNLIPLSHEVSLFDGSGGNLECVGTIVSSYFILTIASCLYGNVQNKLTIKTKRGNEQNSNSKLEEEQIRNITRIIFHPGFKNSSSENDLAILVLDQDLDINPNSTAKVIPILNESTSMSFSGRSCRENSVYSPLEISEPSRCSSSSSAAFESDKLCLFPLKSNSSDENCKSPLPGSSLICLDEEQGQCLCGILARSPENRGENGQIYTSISSHLKWIQTETASSSKTKTKAKRSSEGDGDGDDVDYKVGEQDFADEAKNTESEDVDYVVGIHIINGTGSGPIPYQLSLRFYKDPSDDKSWEHICGAVIVDETTAITAAHCFKNTKDASRYRVVAGEDRLNTFDRKEQVLPLKNIIIHPNYTAVTNGNDIAVLHMENFQSNKNAQPVWLSRFPNAELANMTAVISGWGKTRNAGDAANFLQKGSVSILPPDDCQMRVKNRWEFTVQNGILCTLNRNVRTCNGDSGRPLVIQNYTLGNCVGNLLVGITSVGAENCELRNTAGGFTEISHFYDWIQENRAEKPCKPNHLPCITGGCYHVDVKCDKERDCSDGTDEMNCPVETATTDPQIINGPIPYQLSLRFYKDPSDDKSWEHICGAVIVDETTAITAAHCVDSTKDASRYRVVAGEDHLDARDRYEQVLPIKKIRIHPNYTDSTNGNNIAILHVDKFQFNKYVGGIPLSRLSNAELSDKEAMVSGWGQTSNERVVSKSLQIRSVSILPPNDCQRYIQRLKFSVQKGILCGKIQPTRLCAGNSGGPLVLQNYRQGRSVGSLLLGVHSFGATNCERRNTTDGFTEISHFYDWIQENRATKA